MSVAGFVVAGGRSSRMGRDKALLPWEGGTLLDHAIARLRAVSSDVTILCGPEPRYEGHGVPVAVDLVSEAGSMGGLLTGLARAQGRPGLFLAVDVPGVGVDLLAHLARLCGETDAVVPVSARGPEPLCAVYGPACLGPVERAVARGALKMTSFWPEVRVREVGAAELAAFGDPTEVFRNVNTPADYDREVKGR